MVTRVELQGLYYPTIDDPDLAIIKATQAWQAGGGPASAGEGIKIAIVDSGIDIRHPCFADAAFRTTCRASRRVRCSATTTSFPERPAARAPRTS
jgi:subtilisin family serine protease